MSDSTDDWQKMRLKEQESKERTAQLEHGPCAIVPRIFGAAAVIHLIWAVAAVRIMHICFVLCPGWK